MFKKTKTKKSLLSWITSPNKPLSFSTSSSFTKSSKLSTGFFSFRSGGSEESWMKNNVATAYNLIEYNLKHGSSTSYYLTTVLKVYKKIVCRLYLFAEIEYDWY